MPYFGLNFFFHLLHIALISFALGGWAFPQTRLAHLGLLFLTLGSWFVLGLWMGRGYCPVTDWHWKIKDALGEGRPSGTYIHLLSQKLGLKLGTDFVDKVVVFITFFLAFLSVSLNVRDWLTS